MAFQAKLGISMSLKSRTKPPVYNDYLQIIYVYVLAKHSCSYHHVYFNTGHKKTFLYRKNNVTRYTIADKCDKMSVHLKIWSHFFKTDYIINNINNDYTRTSTY